MKGIRSKQAFKIKVSNHCPAIDEKLNVHTHTHAVTAAGVPSKRKGFKLKAGRLNSDLKGNFRTGCEAPTGGSSFYLLTRQAQCPRAVTYEEMPI